MGKLADQLETESLKLVLLDQFVQVDGQQFEGDAHVIAEDKTVVQVNNVHLVVLVLLLEVLEDLDLLLGLAVKPRLIPHHFQRHVHVILVVVSFDYLAKTSLADHFKHFVAIGHVIVDDVNVRILLVVVAGIVRRHYGPFLGHRPDEVNVRIIEDFLTFVGC